MHHIEPSSVTTTLHDPQWFKAMTSEYEALQKNKNWSLVPYTANMILVGNKWIFKVKLNADGSL